MKITKLLDEVVQRIITVQYQRDQQLLKDHRPALENVIRQLLETKSVDGAAIKRALAEQAG